MIAVKNVDEDKLNRKQSLDLQEQKEFKSIANQ